MKIDDPHFDAMLEKRTRNITRRVREVDLIALAADRLQMFVEEKPHGYDYGTLNLIRDLREMAGQGR